MTFPKAENGIRKVYAAQILLISSSIATLAASVAGLILYLSQQRLTEDFVSIAKVPLILLSIFAVVLMFVGYILVIIGVFKASGDDENFKVALYSIAFGVVLSVIGVIWSGNNQVSNISQLLITLTGFLSIIYVIQGIRNLAVKLEKAEMDSRGSFLYKLFSLFYLIITCINVASLIFADSSSVLIAGILTICSGLITIVQYILFFRYISKAKRILSEN